MVQISVHGDVAELSRTSKEVAEGEGSRVSATLMLHCMGTLLRTLGFPVRETADPEADGDARKDSAAASAAPTAPAEAEEDETGASEEEEERLGVICQKLERLDANLPEFEPASSLRSTLRPYQKQSLGWMREKELLLSESAKNASELHPLWRAFAFCDGTPFYFNTGTGALSVVFPAAARQCRGGILADAMGLGKTVQALALITTLLPDESFFTAADDEDTLDPEDGDAEEEPPAASRGMMAQFVQLPAPVPKRSGATLIVCPMSLLSQWRDEVLKHTNFPPDQVCATKKKLKTNTKK